MGLGSTWRLAAALTAGSCISVRSSGSDAIGTQYDCREADRSGWSQLQREVCCLMERAHCDEMEAGEGDRGEPGVVDQATPRSAMDMGKIGRGVSLVPPPGAEREAESQSTHKSGHAAAHPRRSTSLSDLVAALAAPEEPAEESAPRRGLTAPSPPTPEPEENSEAGTFNCLNEDEQWSQLHRDWCCVHWGFGCAPSTIDASGDPQERSLRHRASASKPPRYACRAQEDWEKSWSIAQLVWCCAHSDKDGCPNKALSSQVLSGQMVSDGIHVITDADDADKDSKKGRKCKEAPEDAPSDAWSSWSGEKWRQCCGEWDADDRWSLGMLDDMGTAREYCCLRHRHGCPKREPPSPAEVLASPMENRPRFPLFNCTDGVLTWKDSWAVDKAEWCCQNERLGCPGGAPPRSLLQRASGEKFNCEDGAFHWDTLWSPEKKEWCCRLDKLGCHLGAQLRANAQQKSAATGPVALRQLKQVSEKTSSNITYAPGTKASLGRAAFAKTGSTFAAVAGVGALALFSIGYAMRGKTVQARPLSQALAQRRACSPRFLEAEGADEPLTAAALAVHASPRRGGASPPPRQKEFTWD